MSIDDLGVIVTDPASEFDPVQHDVEQGRLWVADEISDLDYFTEARERASIEAAEDYARKIIEQAGKSGQSLHYLDNTNPDRGIKIITSTHSTSLRQLINKAVVSSQDKQRHADNQKTRGDIDHIRRRSMHREHER